MLAPELKEAVLPDMVAPLMTVSRRSGMVDKVESVLVSCVIMSLLRLFRRRGLLIVIVAYLPMPEGTGLTVWMISSVVVDCLGSGGVVLVWVEYKRWDMGCRKEKGLVILVVDKQADIAVDCEMTGWISAFSQPQLRLDDRVTYGRLSREARAALIFPGFVPTPKRDNAY